jgi:hypothetical protein
MGGAVSSTGELRAGVTEEALIGELAERRHNMAEADSEQTSVRRRIPPPAASGHQMARILQSSLGGLYAR